MTTGTQKKGVSKQTWKLYGDWFAEIATQWVEGKELKWRNTKVGLKAMQSSNAARYCNGAAQTVAGEILFAFIHNDKCFGSAGCTTTTVGITGDKVFAAKLAKAFWGMAE